MVPIKSRMLLALSIGALAVAGCGGGSGGSSGGSSSSGGTSNSGTFTLEVTEIQISRLDNGEPVMVEGDGASGAVVTLDR